MTSGPAPRSSTLISDGVCRAWYNIDQIRYEVPTVIARATHGRPLRLSQEVAQALIAALPGLAISTVETTEPLLTAFPLVHRNAIAYPDGVFLALAQRLELPFITVDRRLHNRVRHLPEVLWLGAYRQIVAAIADELADRRTPHQRLP